MLPREMILLMINHIPHHVPSSLIHEAGKQNMYFLFSFKIQTTLCTIFSKLGVMQELTVYQKEATWQVSFLMSNK